MCLYALYLIYSRHVLSKHDFSGNFLGCLVFKYNHVPAFGFEKVL